MFSLERYRTEGAPYIVELEIYYRRQRNWFLLQAASLFVLSGACALGHLYGWAGFFFLMTLLAVYGADSQEDARQIARKWFLDLVTER